MKQISIILLLLAASLVHPQSNRILLDENFSDWSQTDLIYTDTQGDYAGGEYDLLNLWASNDEHYLFLRFEIAEEVILQEDNTITIYVDTDNNASTGRTLFGVGSELEFNFGEKEGIIHLQSGDQNIYHDDIGLVSLPTVESNIFEIAINKDVTLLGQQLFSNPSIKILMISNVTVGDRLPNEDGGVLYTFKNETLPPLPVYSIGKESNEYLRVLCYNPQRIFIDNEPIDGLFDPDRIEHHRKIFQAVEPDIIGLVEMYAHTSQETSDRVGTFISPSPSGSWYHEKESFDLILLSRFPITNSYTIRSLNPDNNYQPDTMRSGAFLLNLRPKYDTDLLVILSHPKCCSGNDNRRQAQIDAVMQFVNNAKSGIGDLTIDSQTPIVFMGDMNFVGSNRVKETVLTGDIFDNQRYGEDFNPDWDNSNLEDLKPFTTDVPMTFTSYNEENPYSPGRLDYIFYSGSVMEAVNSYALFTRNMPSEVLAANGLAYNTTTLASDHLPLVADFYFPNITDTEETDEEVPTSFHLKQNFPNPFNPETMISYTVPAKGSQESLKVRLKIYDILGKEIETLVNEEQHPGRYEVKFDIRNKPGLPSGVYFYAILVGSEFDVKKMTLLK
ncbi:endonuclease/exonuclease/phosphatase family protein [Bacteroidota bacterium]